MRVICSYCRGEIGEKEPLDDNRTTHSMCAECVEHFSKQWDGLKLGKYLDSFEAPVLVVNAEGRTVAANQRSADMLGKCERDLYGLLGGEVMECVYARLPEGCGRTIHCKTCTIRITLMSTMETGEPRVRVPAYLDQERGRVQLMISAFKEGSLVRVVIEELSSTQ